MDGGVTDKKWAEYVRLSLMARIEELERRMSALEGIPVREPSGIEYERGWKAWRNGRTT